MVSPATKFPAPSTAASQAASKPRCGAGSGRRCRDGKEELSAAPVSGPSSLPSPGTPVSELATPLCVIPLVLKPKAEDEWTTVLPRRLTRKKHGHDSKEKPRSEITPTPGVTVPWTPSGSPPASFPAGDDTVAKLVDRVRVSMTKLESSGFFRCFLSNLRLHPSIKSQLSRWCPEPRSSAQMVVYGIGSIESYEPPRLQLALAILLRKELGLCPLVEIFDPVLSSIECAAIEELGCRVLSVNERGRRAVVSPVLFYMPHCEADLYDNLLSANWDPESLNKMVVLGNSFQEYQNLVSGLGRESKVDAKAKYVLKANNIVEEVSIYKAEEGKNESTENHKKHMDRDEVLFRAFHSTSWHFFDLDVSAGGFETEKDG